MSPLSRRLNTKDAVVVGLTSMIGAGIFAAFAPAAAAAGSALPWGLALAAIIAFCNASSSAALAARYPSAGGAYVYGREQLSPFWGYLAGWGFVVGKIASCAAMALTAATYLFPDYPKAGAVGFAIMLAAVNYVGITRTAGAARVLLALTLVALAVTVFAAWFGGAADLHRAWPALTAPGSAFGVLQSAGLLFFAFAGYARIATLGEEVREPARTIPRAIPIALGIVVVLYAGVGLTLLASLGPHGLATSPAPLATAAASGSMRWLAPAASLGAGVASLGALLALLAGVGRTTLAMARERDLPASLAAVHPRYATPYRAEAVIVVAVVVLVVVTDLRAAIGFSSFGVLVYYAIANASALRLPESEASPATNPATTETPGRWFSRGRPVVGLVGCVVLACTLPWASVLGGLACFAVGTAIWFLRHRNRRGG